MMGVAVKLAAEVALPELLVTWIGPVDAPAGIQAWISVSQTTLKTIGMPLTVTEVTAARCVPTMSMSRFPGTPFGGRKLEMVGAACMVIRRTLPAPAFVPFRFR